MKLLLDMNLSPRWIQTLEDQGWEAVHWTSVGDPWPRPPFATAGGFGGSFDFAAQGAASLRMTEEGAACQ